MSKCKVTFLPDNKTVEARVGETILEIALNHDIPLHHACGGYCACTTCQIHVKQGAQNLVPMEEEEQERLSREKGITPESRLGCQSKVTGDVTVERVNL
jgi:2Fe-2S ferredoxin